MCWPLFLEWWWWCSMFVSLVVCFWDKALVLDSSCSLHVVVRHHSVGFLEKTLVRVAHHRPVNMCGCVHVCHALRTEISCLLRYSLQLHSHTIKQPLKTPFNGFPVCIQTRCWGFQFYFKYPIAISLSHRNGPWFATCYYHPYKKYVYFKFIWLSILLSLYLK